MQRNASNVELVFINSLPSKPESDSTKADSEYESFLKTLSKKEKSQIKSIEADLQSISVGNEKQPLKYRLLISKMPSKAKVLAMNKLKSFSKMTVEDQEYFKLNDWFQTLLKIPFEILTELPVNKYDVASDLSDFLSDTKNRLDSEIHGLQPVKHCFMQTLAQWITNPESTSSALGLEGQPGCGKTMSVLTFAKILNRPFHLIGLGGCKDSSYLIGHDFTYLGSKCGYLVETLISSHCMNPIIFFDELDKLSETPQGREITGWLIHLIDQTQNRFIQDRYLSGVHLDLSRALFIFSYNDVSKIDSILLDRINNIKILPYDRKDKKVITRTHLLPTAFKNVGLHPDLISLDDTCIDYIIDNFTDSESGVRKLKRIIEHICQHINLLLLTRRDDPITKLTFNRDDFPINLKQQDIDELLQSAFPKNDQKHLSYFI